MHPLDAPVWSALTTRQAALARGDGLALRFAPDHALFAAAIDRSAEALRSLAALPSPGETIATFQADEPPLPPGLDLLARRECHQLLAGAGIADPPADVAIEPMSEEDAAAMLALALLTRPGPFFARTHRLGAFVGVRVEGKVVAMAGERLKPYGFAEISGVCTHPDYRGRGLAGALLRRKATDIAARGETAFLHSYSDNAGAIALYEAIGFTFRRRITLTLLRRP